MTGIKLKVKKVICNGSSIQYFVKNLESQTDAPDKAHERMSICLLLIVKALSVVMCDVDAVVAFW